MAGEIKQDQKRHGRNECGSRAPHMCVCVTPFLCVPLLIRTLRTFIKKTYEFVYFSFPQVNLVDGLLHPRSHTLTYNFYITEEIQFGWPFFFYKN